VQSLKVLWKNGKKNDFYEIIFISILELLTYENNEMSKNLIPGTLNETSLSIVVHNMENHDCGTITAFRSKEECGGSEDTLYSLEDNKKRNRQLHAILETLGYGVTDVDGAYIENFGTEKSVEVKEDVYFVVDSKDTGNLERDLRRLGEQYDQDSIMFIPKGEMGILIGTNHCSDFPGYGKKMPFSSLSFGKPAEFMTKVRNMPFVFEDSFLEQTCNENYYSVANIMGKWAISNTAKKDWRNIQL
jgi:hypothetical protein